MVLAGDRELKETERRRVVRAKKGTQKDKKAENEVNWGQIRWSESPQVMKQDQCCSRRHNDLRRTLHVLLSDSVWVGSCTKCCQLEHAQVFRGLTKAVSMLFFKLSEMECAAAFRPKQTGVC